MFLAWNYTLELFFWIITCAVILVSLTIFFASPRFRVKKTSESTERLSLSGQVKSSSKEKVITQKRISSSSEIELEIIDKKDEKIEERKIPFSIRLRNYLPLIVYIFYSYWIMAYGFLYLVVEFQDETLMGRDVLLGCGICLSGMATLYGFLAKKEGFISTIEQSSFINNSYRLIINLQQELTCLPSRPNPNAIFLACQFPIPVIGSA